MSGNTTNLGKQAATGVLIADTVRSAAMEVGALTLTGNLNATSATFSGNVFAPTLGVGTTLAAGTISTIGNISSGADVIVSTNMSSATLSTGSGTVTNTITAKSFSQPKQVVGSAASPSTTLTSAYSASFTRYIWYYPVTNNTQFNKTFSITSFPDGFFATNSAFYDATFVATGPWTVGGSPITTADLYADENTNTLNVNVITPVGTPPVFTGTCYVKVIISLSVD